MEKFIGITELMCRNVMMTSLKAGLSMEHMTVVRLKFNNEQYKIKT